MSIETGNGSSHERKSQRYKICWSSRVLMPDHKIVAARARDVSVGGVGFESAEPLAMGAEISIELSPWHKGQQHVIRAKCIIVYSMLLAQSAGFSHGAKFSMIPADQLARLKSIMRGLDSQ